MWDIGWNKNMIRQSMKRKINLQFMGVIFIAIITMMVLLSGAFYQMFQNEVMDDLKTYAMELKCIGLFDDAKNINLKDNYHGLRVTVVSKKGEVVYENCSDAEEMGNHKNRPEIKEAFDKGEGKAIRKSATLEENTYYYALDLGNDHVLRVARESKSVWSIFLQMLRVVVIITLLMLFVIFVSTRYLTKSIIRPIEQMANDMEHMENVTTYEEMQPFIDTILAQHEDIMKNAQVRQEFTANVSHELKTPLTAISGYAELIENGMATDKDVIRFSREIHRNSNRLLSLINDIIRLSQLDVVDNDPVKEEVDLYEVSVEQVEMLQFSAEKRGVTLSLTGNTQKIYANKMMMEELVYNLIDNGIRYNKEEGQVSVEVGNRDGQIFLAVSDTGIGISEENQERIFERFYRVDKSHSRQIGGTGLGLAIVKHIVAKHQAQIRVESQIGKGTRIVVLF